MLNLNFLGFYHLIEYGFGLLLLNIIIYLTLLLLIFYILFLVDFKKIKTLNDFKNLSILNFINISLFFSILSLAGVPPLLGFIGKFLLIIFILLKSQYFIFVIFSFTNLFMLYFYIQNLRFTVKKTLNHNSVYNNNLDNPIKILNISILVFLGFFNIFGIFIFNNFIIYINNISIYLYIS